MLKRFIFENFSSYKEETVLDFTAGTTEKNESHVVNAGTVKLLKTALIYGANASGKSNIVKAFDFAKDIILEGIENVDTYKKYFRLDERSHSNPTRFEFEIEIDNSFYSYGFSTLLHEKVIKDEWLYKISSKNPEKIFERTHKTITFGKKIENVSTLKKRFEIYAEDIQNQKQKLFLTEIAEKNLALKSIQIFKDVYNYFDKKVVIIYPDTRFALNIDRDLKILELYKQYLKSFDTGINDIDSIEEDFENIAKKFPEKLKIDIERRLNVGRMAEVRFEGQSYVFKKEESGIKVKKIGLIHASNDFQEVFELKEESDGTIRLLDLIPLIGLWDKDATIFIDEFERSLHPKLTKKFLELFYALNTAKTQMILTTHESTLLDLELVRRDEVWFVEKKDNASSRLYSLEQFKERYDKKIEKAYLLGRYGAVPIFKSFDNFLENE